MTNLDQAGPRNYNLIRFLRITIIINCFILIVLEKSDFISIRTRIGKWVSFQKSWQLYWATSNQLRYHFWFRGENILSVGILSEKRRKEMLLYGEFLFVYHKLLLDETLQIIINFFSIAPEFYRIFAFQ